MAKTAEEYYNAGNEKVEQGNYAGAIADYDQAIILNPDHAKAYYNRGVSKYDLKRYEAAIADYDEAIKLKHGFAEAYVNRGVAKGELKQYEAAIADFNKAIELSPGDAESYNNRGNAKTDLKQYEAAIADYDQAIKLNPDHAKAYYNRGNVKRHLKQYGAAHADYDQAIELKPDYAKAIHNRAAAMAFMDAKAAQAKIEKQYKEQLAKQQQQFDTELQSKVEAAGEGILEGLNYDEVLTEFEQAFKTKETVHKEKQTTLFKLALWVYLGLGVIFIIICLITQSLPPLLSLLPWITTATLMLVPVYLAERRAARDKDQALALRENIRTIRALTILVQHYSKEDKTALSKLFDYHIQSGVPTLILGKDSPPIMPPQAIIEKILPSNKPGD